MTTDDFYKWAMEGFREESMHKGRMTALGFVCDRKCPAEHDEIIESLRALEASENPWSDS